MDTAEGKAVTQFIHDLTWPGIPADVQHMAGRALLDLVATLSAGGGTELSRIARTMAARVFGGDEATLLFDGRRVGAAGAALANGMGIDAMDMHDGYRPAKGHAGVVVFPVALAMGEGQAWRGEQFMAALVGGYEMALRAGVALHRTACDYHTSGAWGAIAAAAVTARALGLDTQRTRHALGIAEYHGPRSPMMRCIDHPSMLKDGSGWGAMCGVLAAQFAAEGFSGAPASTVEDEGVRSIWADLGEEWLMSGLYFKPYACCRWAQPAVEATLGLLAKHTISPAEIARIEVRTFEEATHLTRARPEDTEQAQYSLPYPVAAALYAGRLDPAQVLQPAIFEEEVLQLAERVAMSVDEQLDQRFPDEALARVTIHARDGRSFTSPVCAARGDPADPLSDAELEGKFNRLVGARLAEERASALRRACWEAASLNRIEALVELLAVSG
ncbi:MAG: MmgE/PrpD family protein [Anaerolineales bacterium]